MTLADRVKKNAERVARMTDKQVERALTALDRGWKRPGTTLYRTPAGRIVYKLKDMPRTTYTDHDAEPQRVMCPMTGREWTQKVEVTLVYVADLFTGERSRINEAELETIVGAEGNDSLHSGLYRLGGDD